MPDLLVLQHIECEPLGKIAEALQKKKLSFQTLRPFQGESIPSTLGDASGLIVMGGPMGVYEQNRYPFLSDEIRLIEKTIREKKPVLGICLGSQLLAAALGASVTKGKKKEIGWFPVHFNPAAKSDFPLSQTPNPLMAFHWHGDVFDLPQNAVGLAASERTPLQAFRYGQNVYGLLFHMEVTKEIIRDWTHVFAAELKQESLDPSAIFRGEREHLPVLHQAGAAIYEKWAELVKKNSVLQR